MFIVEMYHGRYDSSESHRFFRCHYNTWKKLLVLALENGWNPKGTKPSPNSKSAWKKYGEFESDYEPDDIMYEKMICKEDSQELADALEKGLSSPSLQTKNYITIQDPPIFKDGISDDEFIEINRNTDIQFVEEFIDFLRKGEFYYSWDD